MMRLACLAALVATAHSFQMAPARPLLSGRATAARSVVKAAMPPFELLAVLPGLGEGYGGQSSFSQTATGQSGDLNFVVLLAVIFPTVVTLGFFKDGVIDFFNPPPEELPPGWRRCRRSRGRAGPPTRTSRPDSATIGFRTPRSTEVPAFVAVRKCARGSIAPYSRTQLQQLDTGLALCLVKC